MSKHEMTYERGGLRKPKKKAVKTTKKRSVISRKVRSAQRTLWNLLGGVGLVAVMIWMFQFIAGK
jgi:ribonuclease P protein component